MIRRLTPRVVAGILQYSVLFSLAGVAGAAAPVLQTAVSRMTHGSAGTFDVLLPPTTNANNSGVECRRVSAGMTVVLTFDQTVVSGTASISAGVATVGGTTFSGATMTVSLTGVGAAQAVQLHLANVKNASNEALTSADVFFRVLQGDVNADGIVSATDVNRIKAAVMTASAVNGGNFRYDINADGMLSATDVNLVKAQAMGSANVAGGGTTHTAPTISPIINPVTSDSNFTVNAGASLPIAFTFSYTNNTVYYVWATGSDGSLMPASSIAVTTSGSSGTLTLSPPGGKVGLCTVTVYVSDGLTTNSATINVNLFAVYAAVLRPGNSVSSLGGGTATLALSGDLTYANFKYTSGPSNMQGNLTDDALYIGGTNPNTASLVYDLPVARKFQGQPDATGTYKWTFNTAANANPTAAQVIAAIEASTATIIIETSAYPTNGELVGTFQLVSGSQTFTAPAAVPSITYNPPSAGDASRFLQQAAFGGQWSEINSLSTGATTIDGWLNTQFTTTLPVSANYAAIGTGTATYTTSSMYKTMYDWVTTPQPPSNVYGDSLDDTKIHQVWWKNAVTGTDQLRQRIATAYSEIWVVSEVDDNLDQQNTVLALAAYYDMLADDAFVPFYDPNTSNPCLLRDITLSPIMGDYLNMKGNNYVSGQGPNENYAREIMQLFSIGLYKLQPDGTLMLDSNGQPIPTYTQANITDLAHVFTGWNANGPSVTCQMLVTNGAGGSTQSPVSNNWYTPMTVTASKHSTAQKQLIVHPQTVMFPGGQTLGLIPQNLSQTTTSANSELEYALQNLANHPNVGPFLCKQLITRLVTSNPSPGYVYRVAQVFANDQYNGNNPTDANGNTTAPVGKRGNMQAVIKAILTDYEARQTSSNSSVMSTPGYGRTREPMVRIASLLRSLNATSLTGKWKMGHTDSKFNQTIFRSPTVFNFFDPAFQPSGPLKTAGLISPEYDIIYETTIMNASNMITTGVYANYTTTAGNSYGKPTGGVGFQGDYDGYDIYIDFSDPSISGNTGNGLPAYVNANGISLAIDRVNLLLSGSTLDPAAKTIIQNYVTSNFTSTDYLGQAKAIVQMLGTSAQVATQK